MKKRIVLMLLCLVFLIPSIVFAESTSTNTKLKLYFFYGDGCPHCAEAESDFLPTLKAYDDLEIERLEVWYNKDNVKLLEKVAKELIPDKQPGLPMMVIGDVVTIGYSSTQGKEIKNAIEFYRNNNYTDQVAKIKKGEGISPEDKPDSEPSENDHYINVPFFGKVNVSKLSLGLAAIVIGLVDGFNPCAMWILIFLLTTLINLKERKKVFLLGFIFIFTSALTYFLIMFSWLNIVIKISTGSIFRYLIGFFALGAAIYNLYTYYKERKNDGCTVVPKEKRKTIFAKIKKYAYDKRLVIAILGIMLLAVSVNIVELLCSAGLPLVYNELLALNKISGAKAIFYDLLYIIFFMIDDLIVFIIAVKTMSIQGISNKFNKYSHLIGGIIMLIIGLLLIFNPGILMFNF